MWANNYYIFNILINGELIVKSFRVCEWKKGNRAPPIHFYLFDWINDYSCGAEIYGEYMGGFLQKPVLSKLVVEKF